MLKRFLGVYMVMVFATFSYTQTYILPIQDKDIQPMLEKITTESGLSELTWTVEPDPSENAASSIDDRLIFLTQGLIDAYHTGDLPRDEFLMVCTHEVGHQFDEDHLYEKGYYVEIYADLYSVDLAVRLNKDQHMGIDIAEAIKLQLRWNDPGGPTHPSGTNRYKFMKQRLDNITKHPELIGHLSKEAKQDADSLKRKA